jgi:hypothetical protein
MMGQNNERIKEKDHLLKTFDEKESRLKKQQTELNLLKGILP